MAAPEVWGPGMWLFLHTVALEYPENPTLKDKQQHLNFLKCLQPIIPCPKCSNHFKQNLDSYNLDHALENRNNLFEWTVKIHNQVNKSNGKNEWNTSQAYKFYNDKYKVRYETVINYKAIFCWISIICVCFFIYKKKISKLY